MLKRVLIAWWFTWYIFSADRTFSVGIDSGLYDTEATCNQEREAWENVIQRLGPVVELRGCENQDRTPR